MTKRKAVKARPSNKPTHFKSRNKHTVAGWFYEFRGRVDVVVEGGRGPILSIPWRKLMDAARRCRPDEVQPLKRRAARRTREGERDNG